MAERCGFLKAHGLVGKGTVAPIEFSAVVPVGRGYANVGRSEAEETSALVLHKGAIKSSTEVSCSWL